MNILLQSSETLSGGKLLAVHNLQGNCAVTLSGHIFKVVKTRYISTWFPKVNEPLQQLKHIAQSMAFAAPSNARNKIEQAINNFSLRETLRTKKGARLCSYAEFNSNKTYTNKHQYIVVQAGTTIVTGVEGRTESNKNNTNSLVYDDVD